MSSIFCGWYLVKVRRYSPISFYQYIFNVFLIAVFSAVGTVSYISSANAATGVEWLAAQSQTDGSISNASDVSTAYQATAEVLQAYTALGETTQPDIPAAVQYVDSDTFQSTEYLSRRIIIDIQQGNDVTTLVTQLKSYQNIRGGFGELPGYDVSVIDTAFALQALVAAGEEASDTAWYALDYLLQNPETNFGWSDGANTSSVYTTALAVQALLPFRRDYPAAWDSVNAAQGFLLGQQNADFLWEEIFVSAEVLLALIPNTPDQSTLSGSVNALQAMQTGDGSWAGDVYQTALALQVLALAANPPSAPDLSNIVGAVIDAETGLFLPGVTVDLAGPDTISGITAANGAFSFGNATPGNYSLSISYTDYVAIAVTFTALAGQTTDIGTIPLTRSSTATTGIVRGVVTDADSGLPLEGIAITATGVAGSVITDSNGAYQISNVPPSAITLQASGSGYSIASANATMTAGGIAIFSPALFASTGPLSTLIRGVITDGVTGLPLEGVLITVGGATSATISTNAQGAYLLQGLNMGQTTIKASLANYDTATGAADIFGGSIIDFSPLLFSTGTTPPDANTMGIAGIVLDSVTNLPLESVTIQAALGGNTISLLTGADGRFNLNGLTESYGNLAFSLPGYNAVGLAVTLELLKALDLGQIRMRPLQVEELKPDLLPSNIDTLNVLNDPATLAVSGVLSVEIHNQGTAATSLPVDVLAFYDTDNNGRYDGGSDLFLGMATTSTSLDAGKNELLQITLEGQVPFRDAPITVWVDSAENAWELNESNNVLDTANDCKGAPALAGNLELKLKWHWSGPSSDPLRRDVYGPVAVGQLNDDDGDGRITTSDIPDLVFPSFQGADFLNGTLNAVSGADGSELWSLSGLSVTSLGSASLADIDGDGIVEILMVSQRRDWLMAFEHDGLLKWKVPAAPRHVNAPRDAVAIADIDHDGVPEIVLGRRVYNADGTLRWEGNRDYGGEINYGFLSSVADVDLTGDMEIVAGRTLYDSAGNVVWHQAAISSDGFNALGNFDDDDYPEIVLVASGNVYLLEHTGDIKWGPVSLPGGGVGGAPTVADFDGDGAPEIGVAGARNYVVLETDGSLKWTSPTQDFSSHRTGSSVFDFEGDGKAEVLYADEVNFFIYDGTTGNTLVNIENGSGTTLEYPLVVDIDNDGGAEIILTSGISSTVTAAVRGVRVFESATQNWASTRSIWNQHSYHITNINDDGTIPVNEQPSWLTHNTYRLNTFLDHDPLAQADLTASLLKVIDNNAGQSVSLSLRVGNAGAAPSANDVTVSFYDGDPAVTGVLLGSVNLAPLAAGDYRDIQLDNVITLSGIEDVYAVVDATGIVDECNESNNTASTLVNLSTLGNLSVATDQTLYAPNSPVVLSADISNTGNLPGFYTLDLSIEDASGATVQTFVPQTLSNIIVGGSTQAQQDWNTANTLAGVYTLRGVLRSLDNTTLGEAVSVFSIQHPQALGAEVILRALTDKPVYHTSDLVEISGLVRNQTSSTLLPQTSLRLQVFDSSGANVFSQDIPLGDLPPGALRDILRLHGLQSAAEGTYLVQAEVFSDSGALLASDTASFNVVEDLAVSLTGTVTVQSKSLTPGDPQRCTDTVSSTGNNNLTSQNIQQLLVNLITSQEVNASASVVDLQAAATLNLSRSISTNNLAAGDYACVLRARIQNNWQTLAYDAFTITVPPINIDTLLESGNGQRLLVLLDAPAACDKDDHDSDANEKDSSHNDSDEEHDRDKKKTKKDSDNDEDEQEGEHENKQQDEHPSCTQSNDADPHGPQGAPSLTAQRSWLENQLAGQGVTYTLVIDADAFTRELRSGGYTDYALFSEHVKLDEQVQKELREAVYRGEGLLVAGAHDNRHNKLDDALGVEIKDKLDAPLALAITGSAIDTDAYAAGNATFTFADKVSRLTLEGAEIIARYPGLPDCDATDDTDHDEGDNESHDESDKDGHDNDGRQQEEDSDDENSDDGDNNEHEDEHHGATTCQDNAIAITRHAYGNGRSVAIGFDLLAQATTNSADNRLPQLLTEALADIQTVSTDWQPYAPALIRLRLNNTGIATPGRAVITPPLNSTVLDAGNAQAQPDGHLIWPFTLAESESKTLSLWLQLPPQAGPAHTEALIQVGIDPDWSDYDIQLLTLSLATAPTLAQVADPLEALKDQNKHYKKALKKVQKAQGYLDEDKADKALKESLKAAEALADLSTPDAAQIRIQLAQAIRAIARQL